jgi:hypothetical protein
MAIDWNDDAKNMVTSGIEMIPVVGDLLGGLVECLWPSSKEDIWGEIKAQVEALVDQAISAEVYQQVSEDLTGLQNALNDYLQTVQTGDVENISAQWITTKTLFDSDLPHFQSAGYELLLLPLFGQFVNLYLILLRDGVLFGSGWNWDASYQQMIATTLTNDIPLHYSYAANTYNTGRLNLAKATKENDHECQPFKAINTFDRQMNLTVLDFMNMWQYFDATKYPNGATVVLGREVYSDPMGTCDNSGNIVLATPEPTQPVSQVSVWGWDRLDSVQLTYPAGSGPGGVTTTPRMGDGGGSNQPPHGNVFNTSTGNPITSATVTWGSIVNSLQLTFKDGTQSNLLGGNAGLGGNSSTWNFTGEILSSIHINGVSDYYGSADCLVLGFQYDQSQSASLDAIKAIYIASPHEKSVADLQKAFPKVNIPADFITSDLQAERTARWASIKASSQVKASTALV